MCSADSITVVIPAYNEAATIRDLAVRSRKLCRNVIVVDDGSTDGTAACLSGLDIELIHHERNLGKAAALWRGMQKAKELGADSVVTLDGDGQHRPEDIPALVERARTRASTIVIGARTGRRQNMPFRRYLANVIADFWVSWAAGYPIEDTQSGFRVYPAGLLKEIRPRVSKRWGFVFESEILIEAARRGVGSHSVPIPSIYAPELRPSHFRPVADIVGITMMVAARLLRRGLYPQGLYRSFIRPNLRRWNPPGMDADALLVLSISCLAGVATLGLGFFWFLYRVNARALAAPSEFPHADAVVVLGQRLKNGRISGDFRLRLDRALRLVRQNRSVRLFIVGGRRENGITEAEAGSRYLIGRGVDPDRIVTEHKSANTVQNLLEIRPALNRYRRVAVVSNRYHLERIATLASGMSLPLAACGAERKYRARGTLPRSLVEAFYLHWYWSGRTYAHLTKNTRMLGKIGRHV